MSEIHDLLTTDEASVLGTLPRHVRSTIAELRNNGLSDEDIAREWLAPPGPQDQASYGSGMPRTFFDAFKREFNAFLCGHERYREDREKLEEQAKQAIGGPEVVQAMLVTWITVAITKVIGASAAIVAPAVALMLLVVAKIGARAWCVAVGEAKD